MLHLVPQWQSAERHRKLKVMMQVGVFFFLESLIFELEFLVFPTQFEYLHTYRLKVNPTSLSYE